MSSATSLHESAAQMLRVMASTACTGAASSAASRRPCRDRCALPVDSTCRTLAGRAAAGAWRHDEARRRPSRRRVPHVRFAPYPGAVSELMQQSPTSSEVDEAVAAIYRDGIVGRKGAFPPGWADEMREDIEVAFADARTRERGAVGRGPARWYVAIHPEQMRGFVDLVSHPWLTAVCEAVLGPDYEVVELGFDIPFAGAKDQPWHRDFASPEVTWRDRRLTSLAFNLTAVDTTEDMGPFEVAVGTQFERGEDFAHGMFPDRSEFPRFAALGSEEDAAARRHVGPLGADGPPGTANRSEKSRPVLDPRRGRPRREPRGPARHDHHAGVRGLAAARGAPPPGRPGGRPARAHRPDAPHRGPRHGRGLLEPAPQRGGSAQACSSPSTRSMRARLPRTVSTESK